MNIRCERGGVCPHERLIDSIAQLKLHLELNTLASPSGLELWFDPAMRDPSVAEAVEHAAQGGRSLGREANQTVIRLGDALQTARSLNGEDAPCPICPLRRVIRKNQ